MAYPGASASAFLHTATNSVFTLKGIPKIMRPKGSIYYQWECAYCRISEDFRQHNVLFVVTFYK